MFADDEIEDIVDDYDMPGPMADVVIQSTLHDYTGGTTDRFKPEPGFDEDIIRQTAGSAREGFAWAFRQAAFLILTVLPLLGALKRTPAQARAEFMAQMQAQQKGETEPEPEPTAPSARNAATAPTGRRAARRARARLPELGPGAGDAGRRRRAAPRRRLDPEDRDPPEAFDVPRTAGLVPDRGRVLARAGRVGVEAAT